MKHSYFAILLGLILVAPMTAAAQDTEADEASADTSAEETADTTADADVEAGAEAGVGVEAEVGVEADVEADAEVADTSELAGGLSSTGVQTEAEQTGAPSPTLAEDLADASHEEEDADELDAEDDVDVEEEQLPWRNSLLLWDHSLNTTTFDPSSTLTHNPTYVMGFSIRPRWYLDEDMFVHVRQDMDVELTESDTRTQNRELWFYDTRVGVAHPSLLEVEEIKLGARGDVRLPLSQTSQAANRIFGMTGGVTSSRAFENVLSGLTLGATFDWTHYFATSNVIELDGDTDLQCVVADGTNRPSRRFCGAVPSSTADSAILSLTASLMPIEDLSVDLGFLWWWVRGHGLGDATVPVDSAPGGTVTLEDGSDTHWRNSTWFTVEAGYAFTDYFTLAGGFSTLSSQLAPDGGRRNPFWNVDSVVTVTAALQIDALWTSVRGSSVADADEADGTATAAAQNERSVQ